MKIAIAVSMALLSSAVSVSAADDAKDEKLICKSQKVTGSLTKRNKRCRTQEFWDEEEARARAAVDRMHDSANKTNNPVSDPFGGFAQPSVSAGGPIG